VFERDDDFLPGIGYLRIIKFRSNFILESGSSLSANPEESDKLDNGALGLWKTVMGEGAEIMSAWKIFSLFER